MRAITREQTGTTDTRSPRLSLHCRCDDAVKCREVATIAVKQCLHQHYCMCCRPLASSFNHTPTVHLLVSSAPPPSHTTLPSRILMSCTPDTLR